MDEVATGRGATRVLVVGLVALALVDPTATGATSRQGVDVIGSVTLYPAPAIARELTAWSLGRFEKAGLSTPAIEVLFHPDAAGCGGHLGLARSRRVDLCVRGAMEPGPQRIVLHEFAHVWIADNGDTFMRRRFLAFRALASWFDPNDPWKARGVEQAAEIVAWGLGDGSMLPMINGVTDRPALASAFRLLTGSTPLRPT
ncbi:MAG: hypothetical protein OEV60_08230 [Actinomycetota bacterium]|nr:hypothetical protein [Actinomycetota bacterium]MDH5224938.1 hypothetical protein [Actinomycetota bacterium]MDH5312624.1 hypothetical protein [Actinomycetota bacterium]